MPRITTWVTENAKRLREQLALFERNTLDQFGDFGNRIARVIASIPTTLPPSGAATGDLTGTYPGPFIAPGVIVDADVNPSAGILLSKLANIATARVLGRRTAASGPIEQLEVTVPTRAVDLSEWHRLDPWSVYKTDLTNYTGAALEWANDYVCVEVGGATADNLAITSNANHPGVIRTTSLVAVANTGLAVSMGTFQLLGDEYSVVVFRTPASFVAALFTGGFYNSRGTVVEPNDGAYLWLNGSSNIQGKTANGGVRSTTGSTLALSVSTWYTGIVRVNANKTLITYYVYNDAGTQLWTDTVAANIPTTQALYAGAKCGSSGVVAVDCGDLDYIETRVGGPGRTLGRYLGSAAEVLQ